MLGNVINIVGQGLYCIKGFTSTSIVTVDRALGTFATTSGKVGGAFAGVGLAGSGAVSALMTTHVQSGAYSITTATPNVSGGPYSSSAACNVIGYNSTRLDGGTKPVLTANAALAGIIIVTASSTYSVVSNLDVDCNSNTTSTGINSSAGALYGGVFDCIARNAVTGFSGDSRCFRCTAVGCTTGFTIDTVDWCYASGGTTGFTSAYCRSSVAYDCSGKGFSGYSYAYNCVAYSCGATGFYNTNASRAYWLVNCISYGNTGYGFRSDSDGFETLINCAAGSNSSGAQLGFTQVLGLIALSGDPFTNAAGGDFSLDTTAGEGALCRAAGFPTSFNAAATNVYRDVGAAQHQDPAGGAGGLLTHPGMAGGMRG